VSSAAAPLPPASLAQLLQVVMDQEALWDARDADNVLSLTRLLEGGLAQLHSQDKGLCRWAGLAGTVCCVLCATFLCAVCCVQPASDVCGPGDRPVLGMLLHVQRFDAAVPCSWCSQHRLRQRPDHRATKTSLLSALPWCGTSMQPSQPQSVPLLTRCPCCTAPCSEKVARAVHLLVPQLAAEQDGVRFGTSQALRNIITDCLDDELIAAAARGAGKPPLPGQQLPPVQSVVAAVVGALGARYEEAWHLALPVASTLLERLGSSGRALAAGLIEAIGALCAGVADLGGWLEAAWLSWQVASCLMHRVDLLWLQTCTVQLTLCLPAVPA
jgi:hypothetical protein